MSTRTRYRKGGLTSKVFAPLMAIVLCVGFIPYVPAAYADPGLVGGDPVFGLTATGEITGGDVINENGEYSLADGASGTITIGEGVSAKIVGASFSGSEYQNVKYEGLYFVVQDGATLTLENVYISNGATEKPAVNFASSGSFNIEGTNIIDVLGNGGSTYGVVHAAGGSANTVTLGGNGTLFAYKDSGAALIGSNKDDNGEDPCANIVFNSGTWNLKGTRTGAIVGNDMASSGYGTITINGGELHLKAVARGACLGGSASGYAADVVIAGGLVECYTEFDGSAVGGAVAGKGAASADFGTLTITGGSLKTMLGTNVASMSKAAYGFTDEEWDAASSNSTRAFVSEKAITAANDKALLVFDMSEYAGQGSAVVNVDDNAFYSGASTYNYVVNEQKNPTGLTDANFLPNIAASYVGDDAIGGQGPGSSLAPDANLYFWLSKSDHVLKINNDKYNATWDAEAGAFTVAKYDPAANYDWESSVWAGGLDFSWYDASDVKAEYHLSTPAQWEALAWICSEHLSQLAEIGEGTYTNGNVTAIKGDVPTAQNKFEGVKFYLDNDIDMGGVYADGAWSGPNYYPIGSQGANDKGNGNWYGLFYGSFDGQGHYVSNVYANRGNGQSYQSVGLFGRVGAADGEPTPACNITIENVGVSGYIHSGRSVGGIVGKTLHVANGYSVTVKNCVNRADVSSTDRKGVGGVVGALWNAPVYLTDCYSLGTVSGGGSPKGSVVGINEGTVTNVYSSQTNLPVMGELAGGTISNAYRMGTDKTEAEMKEAAFVVLLNGDGSAFNVDTANINGGLPCLAWEGGTPATQSDLQTIEETVAVINSIGEVTVDSKDAIEAAQAAYNALTDEQKALLPAEAQSAYDNALATYAGALVGAIPPDVTSEAGIAAVDEALEVYNSLTDEQKALVSPASVSALLGAEQAVANAKIDAANSAAAAANNAAAAANNAAAAANSAANTANANAQKSEQGRQVALATVAATQKLLDATNAKVTQLTKDLGTAKAAQGLKANPMTVKAKTIKAKAGKKKTVKKSKAFTVKNAKGKVTFYKLSGDENITITKAGKVKVKAGLKAKKKAYKVKVLVCAAGNKAFAPATKTVTLKVKVNK